MIRKLLAIALVAIVLPSVRAQEQLAGASGVDHASHGWVVAQVPGEDEATLVHIPPRVPTGIAMPSAAGRLKAVSALNEPPSFLAADGSSVYLVFPAELDGSFQVAKLGVLPTKVQDHWVREPRDRLRYMPAITGYDRVLGLAVDDGVPTALVTKDSDRLLLQLQNSGWEESRFDTEWDDSFNTHLYATGQGLHLVEHLRDTIVLHTRTGELWTRTELPTSDRLSLAALGTMQVLGVYNGEVIGVVRADPRAEVWSFGEGGPLKLGAIDPPGSPMSAAILHSTGRLVVVWTNEGERTEEVDSSLPSPAISNPLRRVIEFSLLEGRPVYTGQAITRAPVSAGEFRHLALLLMMFMGLVLLLVLRPSPEGDVIVLPPGLAIAGPGRRLLATIIDGMVGLFIVSRTMDMTLLEVLGPLAVPATGRLDVWPLLIALMVNVMHCSFGEALFGRSVGKTLTGLIVARVDKSAEGLPPGQFRPPAPLRSLARNIVKWLVPPVSMLVISEPSGRHRGDLLARSAVLCRAAPPL